MFIRFDFGSILTAGRVANFPPLRHWKGAIAALRHFLCLRNCVFLLRQRVFAPVGERSDVLMMLMFIE